MLHRERKIGEEFFGEENFGQTIPWEQPFVIAKINQHNG
jgi:hypothetical protein